MIIVGAFELVSQTSGLNSFIKLTIHTVVN